MRNPSQKEWVPGIRKFHIWFISWHLTFFPHQGTRQRFPWSFTEIAHVVFEIKSVTPGQIIFSPLLGLGALGTLLGSVIIHSDPPTSSAVVDVASFCGHLVAVIGPVSNLLLCRSPELLFTKRNLLTMKPLAPLKKQLSTELHGRGFYYPDFHISSKVGGMSSM